MNLAVRIGKMEMKNPVMTASGCFGYGEEASEYFDIARLGAVVVKGTTLEERQGNAVPRIAETAAGMLNSIGLQNVGISRFTGEKMPFLRTFDVPVVVNISGKSADEYGELASILESVDGVHAGEINV